jgi:hypothetical protein
VEAEEVLRPAEQPDTDPPVDIYSLLVMCANCRTTYRAQAPRGQALRDTECEHCGVTGDLHAV